MVKPGRMQNGPCDTILNMESHAIYLLFIATVGVLWWVCCWGIFESLADWIEKKFEIPRVKIYGLGLLLIVVIVMFHPQILDKV